MCRLFPFLILLPLLCSCNRNQNATYLFNGKDLSGWDTYLGVPDSSQEVPGLERNEQGLYTDSLGLNYDPLNIFSVVEEDGKPAIRIDGYVWGALITKEEYEDYHLHLEYKWGGLKHPPREKLERNSGICYHSVGDYGVYWTFWMRSFELEIKETALGDFYRVDEVYATIETRVDTTLITPPRVRWEADGFPVTLNTNTYMVRAARDLEKDYGEWNAIDLYVLADTAMHYINGELVMVATALQQQINGDKVPLTRGKIQLQSEGAEIFYRDIRIEPIDELPEGIVE
ncbi:MAG: DUF1080 domain-containing protein [Bacteroidales bacterium]|nr:DUF1080 domain-containing protein [Bacteroidales bacterium]